MSNKLVVNELRPCRMVVSLNSWPRTSRSDDECVAMATAEILNYRVKKVSFPTFKFVFASSPCFHFKFYAKMYQIYLDTSVLVSVRSLWSRVAQSARHRRYLRHLFYYSVIERHLNAISPEVKWRCETGACLVRNSQVSWTRPASSVSPHRIILTYESPQCYLWALWHW